MTTPTLKSWSAHTGAVLTLGLPLIGSHLAQIATHVVDTVMLGWYDVTALAASVLGTTLFFEFFIVGSGFALAVMPMVANAVGSGDERQVRRVARMGMWISAVYAMIALPVLWHTEAILLLLGQNPVTSALAQDYMRIAMWGLAPALVIMTLKSYLSALERPQVVLWVTVSATALNALLNYALIFGYWGAPEMGLRGAALASVLSQVVAAVALIGYSALHPRLRPYALFTRFWRVDRAALAEVFRLGWPIGVTLLAESGLFSASAVFMGWIGTATLAAHGIALQIAAMTFMVHLGLSNAATVRAGRARGEGDVPNLLRGAVTVAGVSFCFALVAVAVFLSVPEFLVSLFLDRSDPQAPQIVVIGVALIAVAAVFQIADGAQVIALGLLRGLADTRLPMILATVSYWGVGIPASYVLGFTLGYDGPGVWFGLVIGLVLAGLTMSARFLHLVRRLR